MGLGLTVRFGLQRGWRVPLPLLFDKALRENHTEKSLVGGVGLLPVRHPLAGSKAVTKGLESQGQLCESRVVSYLGGGVESR